jgi:hypothetical protein
MGAFRSLDFEPESIPAEERLQRFPQDRDGATIAID